MHKNDYEIGSEIRTWGVNIPKRAIVELEKTFASGWINTGPREKQFRQLLTEAFEANHAIACNSGTSALKLALAAAKVGPGDEVISTPYTWLATNTAILEVGAIPVFADIGASSLNIDPDSVADKITSKTKAIMCVHFAGNACDLHRLRDIAATNQLPLIEDCAHSMGAKYDGKMIGNGAHFACFSFQCVKIVTCGDGGAVLTSDAESYDTLKRLSWYGVDRDQKKLTFFDSVPMFPEELGFKMNMNDITATMACVAMEELPHALKQRKELGKIYDEHMVKLERVRAVSRHNLATPNYQIYPVQVENRELFAKFMWTRGIQVVVNNRRNDLYPVFGGMRDLPGVAEAEATTILLPLHLSLKPTDVERVLDAVTEYERA